MNWLGIRVGFPVCAEMGPKHTSGMLYYVFSARSVLGIDDNKTKILMNFEIY